MSVDIFANCGLHSNDQAVDIMLDYIDNGTTAYFISWLVVRRCHAGMVCVCVRVCVCACVCVCAFLLLLL